MCFSPPYFYWITIKLGVVYITNKNNKKNNNNNNWEYKKKSCLMYSTIRTLIERWGSRGKSVLDQWTKWWMYRWRTELLFHTLIQNHFRVYLFLKKTSRNWDQLLKGNFDLRRQIFCLCFFHLFPDDCCVMATTSHHHHRELGVSLLFIITICKLVKWE